ncbi:aminodeoxychorismate synthase subunit I,component of p-aminobenzoate synthase multienzyme complex [Xenorhabdus bovienii str. Jollieti]|uniref:Aminodeoxychorismate synthase component 1 n=1 Tax=Xenorhabdus bovienii (strain SS-2004) TaxID=406818 RepID=D3V1Z2_XENBS|nr:aminodeoxychorismate synthase component 1 [Xenorhabdus bovienii]CBJ81686.1 aminodeoxychorismate synthase subunit I, component of p-aminobenzoate synthase multienzyme complex [Xenorhabdus bovienii SS-2004]CDH27580.1 aminodeoxychorismate synthase subunit I,component of p-aminobenzoate synthase multienzyme complex [Xenorhabdus bovienii str. Jollieti]
MKIALQKRLLPYSPDLATRYFAPLSVSPWAMLLHSGTAEHPHNRFDILVAEPVTTLITRDESTEINCNGDVSLSQEDPFLLLKKHLHIRNIAPQFDPDYPFQGGALGLWGYDLGRKIEKLPAIAANELDFPDMAVGIYDWALIIDHHQQKATLLGYHNLDNRLAWLESQKKNRETNFSLSSQWQSNMTAQQYHEKIAQIHRYLRDGDCYQVNLSQRFHASYQGDEWQAFTQLNDSNRAPFSAFIRLPENCIISVSPERFLLLEDKKIQTRPIKGTLPRLQDPEEDHLQAKKLANSRKDRAENLMIVDLLRNDIGRVATPGSVKVPELFVVEPFPAVHHLVSTITATLPDEYHATDLLRACFPGGSITGAPKIRAMEIIEELEPHRRHGYCGAIGYISFCGTMDSNITIRTLLTEKGKIYCWAGGGIVADSIAEKEYQETFDKLGRILPQLGELHIP